MRESQPPRASFPLAAGRCGTVGRAAAPRSPLRPVTIVSGGAERAQRDPGGDGGGFVRVVPAVGLRRWGGAEGPRQKEGRGETVTARSEPPSPSPPFLLLLLLLLPAQLLQITAVGSRRSGGCRRQASPPAAPAPRAALRARQGHGGGSALCRKEIKNMQDAFQDGR